jgi:DNA-binding transcriptional MerR regulator
MNLKTALSRQYTTPEIAEILGVSTRKVISMLERGYFKPSIQEASGHPSRRLFSFLDVACAYVLFDLLNMGLSVEKMREVGRMLPELIREEYLIIDMNGTICPTSEKRKEQEKLITDFVLYPSFRDDPSPVIGLPLKWYCIALQKKLDRLT